jgi:hypothetical protein
MPASRDVRAGAVMSVMLGVIFAHTGMVALALIHVHTSCGNDRTRPRALEQANGCQIGRDQMSCSACQIGPSVSYWFQWWYRRLIQGLLQASVRM